MDVAVVIVTVVVVVVVGLAWKIRKASVETIVAPPRTARHPQFLALPETADPIVTEPAFQEPIQPIGAHPRETSRNAFVTVLATCDYATLLVAKSLLEATDIPYYAKGEAGLNLIGGQMWGGHSFALGAVELQVPAELAEEAQSLLDNPEPLEE